MAERKPLFMSSEGFSQEMAVGDTATFGGLTLSGAIAMGTAKITGLGDPGDPQDAATKYYVDSVATGLDFKPSVRTILTADLSTWTPAGTGATATLTAPTDSATHNTQNGVTLAATNRVLVPTVGGDLVTPAADNGIYVVTTIGDGAGTSLVLTRAADANASAEVTAGMFCFVNEGTAYADTGWVLATNDTITLDTTALVFTQFSAPPAMTAAKGLVLAGTALSIEFDSSADAQGAGAGGGSSGLELDADTAAGKLRAAVHATGGLERTASGLGTRLNGTTLQSAAGGLSVKGLPLSFEINGSAVNAGFTAANATTLVTGVNADALHTHSSSDMLVAVDEAVTVADPLVTGTTNNRVQRGRADTDAKAYVLGIAQTTQGSIGSNTNLVRNGIATGVLTAATIGQRFYLGDTGGLTAANTLPAAGSRVILIGIAKNATDMWMNVTDFGKRAA